MKNIILIVVFGVIFISCSTNTQPSLAEQNISESEYLIAATNWYQKSAEMRACYFQAFYLAKMQLQLNLNSYKGDKKPAVILDIDETVLDNSPFQATLIKTGKTYTSELWKEWTDMKTAKALPGAVEFTNFAKQNGVEVFYVSNRKVEALEGTVENMVNYGFANADTNFVLLRGESRDKELRRFKVKENHDVLLYIGDNLTDFSSEYEHRGKDLGFAKVDSDKNLFGSKYIVLPNPMYGNWEGSIYNEDYSISILEKRRIRQEILDSY